MITVSILINGKPIYTRTGVNRSDEYFESRKNKKGLRDAYKLDNGDWVFHNPKSGAVKLAVKMLETIKEVK
jgi:hypothetical protein